MVDSRAGAAAAASWVLDALTLESSLKLIIHDSSKRWSGNEQQAILLARALRARGHEVVFACHRRSVLLQRLPQYDLPGHVVGPGGDLDVWSAVRFARWLLDQQPDALLLVTIQRTFWGALSARWAGVPRVLVRIGMVRSLPVQRPLRWALRRHVDAIVVNSEDVRHRLLREEPWLRLERVHLLRNRIELPALNQIDGIRRELRLNPDTLLVAAVGGLIPRKGFDILLRAFAQLDLECVQLVVAGSGPGEATLHSLATALGVADRVHWLGYRRDVPAILSGCDVFCSSSREEGQANALLEAMAAGALIVATEVGGVREAIGPKHDRPPAGWIVPREAPELLAQALREALIAARARSELADARRAEARQRVRQWYATDAPWPELEHVIFGPDDGRST